VVARLVQTLSYKPEVRGFDTRWSLLDFSLTQSFWPHYDPEVDSASNKNEYQGYLLAGKGGLCIGLKTLPHSCADCLQILAGSTSHSSQACPGPCRDCFYQRCGRLITHTGQQGNKQRSSKGTKHTHLHRGK
jgi:hypothetical protein